MKQSTFSAVMANSIKNLLQGYTKGIRFVAVLTVLLTMGIGQAWGADVTLSSSTITSGKKLAYDSEWTYTANNVSWSGYCYTDANSRQWIQLKKDKGVYVKIVTPSGSKITQLKVTITSANNSSGGVNDITKHNDFSGRVALLTEDAAGSTSMTGVAYTTTVSNDIATLNPSGNNNTLYLKVSGGARIWSMTVTYEEASSWKIKGSWDSWTEHAMTVNGTEATCQIDLAQGQGYEFGFDGNGTFYKNSGAIITDISGWGFSTNANNARLYTGPAGTYTFKINTSTKQVQVIYPTVTHPAEGYAYFQKQDSWNGFKVYNYTSDDNRLSDWNGSPSVTNTTTICGKTYYYTALATQFENVIFRDNGSNQWKEIKVSGYSGKYCGDDYNATPQTWKTFNKYSITFNSNGGSGTMSTISGICPGDNQTLPANTFTRTGYTFDGWATSANGSKAYNDKATISNINSNITLYARWKANIYTITSNLTYCSSSPEIPTSYTYTGSAANLTYTITPESGYRLPDAITVSGCTYTWNKTTGQLKLTGTISGDVTITIEAVKVYNITWKVNKQTYTTDGPTTSVDVGATYKNLTLPTPPADNTLKECYDNKKFVGWSTTNIGSTESDKPTILFKTAAEAPNTAITENTILYAVFATESTTGSGSEGWGKVTSTADLKAGDFYAISSAETGGTYLSTYTGGNNYPASSTTICKLELGGSSGAWTFKIADGSTYNDYYLTATSTTGSNHLKAVNSADDYSKFTISFSSNAAVITCTGKTSRNILRYNGSNDPPLFSCYSSGQSAVYLQKYSAGTTTETTGYVTECCTLNNINLDNSGTTTGGTFSATTSKACEGEEITLNATAAECYAFVSWTIKKTSDGSDVTNSVLNGNTLTMPDYAVTVYATFKSLSVTEIALSMTGGQHKNLDVGETNQLVVTYTPADATCDNAIDSWTSSNDNILSVSNTGLVTAQMAGTATITAKTAGGVSATYNITVNNPACDSWYIHYWNNSTSGDECFYKVKPDDANDHEWRTNNFSLPSFSDEDKFIVNNTPEDPYKADQVFRTGIGFADIQRGGQNCGTNPYPGQDAYGQLSIYDDSETANRYIAFYPAQYLVTYGKEGAAPWEVLPLNNTTGYEYETEPFMVPNGYKTDDTYKYYVGITDKNGNIKYVGYEFGGVEYKKSSVDPMNTVNGLSANDMAGKWGTWHIYSNSCANNWYCEFIHYYRVDFNLNGGEGDFAPRYGKATTPYVEFTTTDIGAPTRTGYTFLGWKDQNNKIYAPTDATVTINNDLTLTALWVEEYGSDNCRWEEVTIDDIVYGDEVVIATEKDGVTYALQDNDGGATTAPLAVKIIINPNKTINTLETSISTSLIWNVDYDKEGTKNLVIYSTRNAGEWLYSNAANDGIRIGTNANKEFKIVEGTGNDAGNFFLYHIAQLRYLGVYYQNQEWRGYTTIHTYIAGQTLKFYKKVCLPEGQYRVTWDANGGAWSDGSTTKEDIYTEGATINLPEEPELDGYKFDSWEPAPTTMPDENTTFTAQWAEVCTVTYTVGNGDTAPTEMQAVENTNITLPSLTTNLTCVKFVGWTDADNDAAITSSNIYKAGDTYTVTQDITLKAVYAAGGGFVLVTDANDLAAGDRIVIAAAGFDVAMGADRGSNRGEVEVTKDNDDNTITTPDGIQILTLEAGTTAGTLAFNTGEGYLYAAGGTSSNHLKTTQTLDNKGSWNISINAEGIATIKSVEPTGGNARNWLRYNSTNNPPIFSCYASGQADVSIYKESITGYTTDPECVMYNVTLCTPTNGTISVDKTIVDPYGSTILTFAPAAGYMLDAVTITFGTAEVGTVSYTSNQTSGGTVKISNIQSDIEVCATFKAIPFYKVTFVDMNNGNAETIVPQSEFGGDITAPATASAGCDITWTFIGWAPSNSLNGTTEVPANLVEAGGTISGANITSNLVYYSVYSNSSDGTPPFSIGKSGTYYMYALDGTTKYYATTKYDSNTLRSNNTNFESYPKATFKLDFDSNNSKYKIKVTTNTSEGYLYQPDTYDKELILDDDDLSNYSLFTIINGSETESYRVTYSYYAQESKYVNGQWVTESVLKTGNFGMSSQKFAGRADGYDVYFEPASEMHYYNASDCSTDDYVTMSFHNPFGSSKAQLQYEVGYEEDYYTNTSKKNVDVFPTLEYAGWTFIGWTAGSSYNAAIGDENLNDENSSASAPTQDIYKTGGGLVYYLGGDVTMYPVFTKFEDNEPFDIVNGGDYYIYYIADGDIGTSVDEYGAANRIYAAEYDNYGFLSTQSCADATLFTFTKLPDGKWTIYDNTRDKFVYGVNEDNKLEDKAQTGDGKIKYVKEWTIEVNTGNQVNAVSVDGYVLSAYSQDATTGTFKNYDEDSFRNNTSLYHRVYVGTCTERVYSSNPTNKPAITLSGEPIVTSTQDQSIRAQGELSISATKLAANGTITLTSDNEDVYFATDKTANFSKATKPVRPLTLEADEKGKLAMTTVYVHYKPTSTSSLGVQTANITATTGTNGQPDYATATTTAALRNLPAKFVIATKVGAIWYALPADLTTASNPLGVVIEVDETNMTATAPNSCTYTLFPVKTTNTEYDRYEEYGDRLRFSAVNNSYKGLWANNSKTDLTINNDMVIDQASDGQTGSDLANNSYYEWKVTTTVVDGHWQYTLQTDQTQNQNYLRYWTSAEGTPVGPKWGTYNAGENKLYFLPVTETQPFEYAVVEWYPTKVLIQTDANIASPTVKVGGEKVESPELASKGGNLYEISNLPLETNPNEVLQVSFTADAVNYVNAKVVPIILSREAKSITGEPFATLTQKVYQYADVVVRDGATLTIDGGTDVANTLLGMTIYPTAKVAVAEGYKLSVHNLTFFGGIDEIYDGSAYTINKYGVPQLSLKGTLGKTITNIDYIMRVNLDQMYQVGVPYDVNLSDITYWDGTTMTLGDNLYVSAYDGQKRANREEKSWVWETDFTEKVLKAGIGYTISADKQDAAHEYSIIRMPMKNNITSGNTETAKTVQVYAYDNKNGVEITDNHKGWNYLSNPYMVAISGAEADSKLVVGYLRETGTGPWEWVDDTYRYVTIPSDDGKWYDQQQFEKATLLPFKSFFLQIATSGELSFALASRQGAPARYLQSSNEQREVEFEVLLANDTRSDNLGFLIGEDYTPAYEINADLEKMLGTMSVYTIYGGYNLAYNALSPTNAAEQIPIGYVVPTVGEYIFALDESSDIEDVEHIYLIDYETSAITDLVTDVYTFTTLEQKSDTRFAINVALKSKDNTATGLDNMNTNGEYTTKFIYQDKIYILHHGVIYDATGKRVITINK